MELRDENESIALLVMRTLSTGNFQIISKINQPTDSLPIVKINASDMYRLRKS